MRSSVPSARLSDIVSLMLSRRNVIAGAVAGMAVKSLAATSKMTLCMHQNTSRAAGYRKSLEGWAKAGIKNVELTDNMLEEFLKTDTLDGAHKVVSDLGLKVVSCASVLPDMFLPRPARLTSLE